MASRKKQSEGIALLSMYNDDEEEDDEMEDPDEEAQPQQREEADGLQGEDIGYEEPNRMDLDSATELSFVGDDVGVNEPAASVPSPVQPLTPQLEQNAVILEAKRKVGRGRLTIVDYGHDEVAISPEPEEGEFTEELRTDNDVSQQKTPGGSVQVLSPGIATSQLSGHLEVLQTLGTTETVLESEAVQVEATTVVSEQDVDPLDRFLPPPPKEKCPEELQKRIERFLALKKVGRSFNAEVRNRKDYRNPDFLLHAVRYQDIDQIGSCFSKDVFDPRGYDKSDYYDEIELDMKRERERREQELKKSPKVEFVAGGTQAGLVVPLPKFSMPVSGVNASGLHSVPMTADSFARDGRQSKKSKWDTIKVEPDGRNPLPSGSHDSLSTAAAHAALLSANVGTGYTAFVQQKRREAEEKRSSDRKLERRS